MKKNNHFTFNRLIKAKFIRRYKRFFAEMETETGQKIIAHCPNTGSMKSCLNPGHVVWLEKNNDPKRKLKYTWHLSETTKDKFLCINTQLANKVVEIALAEDVIPELSGYTSIRREIKYGTDSKIDFLLERDDEKCFLEVKSVTLKIDENAYFPDSVTSRGKKHLLELAEESKKGNRAVLLFLINRSDVNEFYLAKAIDPEYCEAFKKALDNNVEILVYFNSITSNYMQLGKKIILNPYSLID